MQKENKIESTEPGTGTGELEKVEGNNITLAQVEQIIAQSIAANNKKFEELQQENEQLKEENFLNAKLEDLKEANLDLSLIVFLSNDKEERKNQIEILQQVIQKAREEVILKDMKENPFEIKKSNNNNEIHFTSLTPFEKIVRGK